MEADVDFDQDVEPPPRVLHRLGPAARDLEMIDDDRDRRAIHQGDDARRVGGIHRVRQPNVLDARLSEDLCLAELGAEDADGAAIDLPRRDNRRFVGLGVRAKPSRRIASCWIRSMLRIARAWSIRTGVGRSESCIGDV
jgi:hypothetical protein